MDLSQALSWEMTVCGLLPLQVYRNLQYFVPMPGKHKKDESGKKARLELLKTISGSAVPGQLTALMGGSGAGKVRPPLIPKRCCKAPGFFLYCVQHTPAVPVLLALLDLLKAL